MVVVWVFVGKLLKENLHGISVAPLKNAKECLSGQGFDGPETLVVLADALAGHRGTYLSRAPATARLVDPAEARFILAPQTNAAA
jgi:hypothetical protein